MNEILKQLQAGNYEALGKKFDKETYRKMRMDSLRSIRQNPDGYDCPLCNNRRSIPYEREDGTLVYRTCSCYPTWIAMKHMKQSGLGNRLESYTFENFRAEEPWQKRCLETARAYAEAPEGWFFIGGQSGSGKTHLCTAICRKLLEQGKTVRYFSWSREAERLKNYREPQKQEALKEELQSAEVLYIDDFLKMPGCPGDQKPSSLDLREAVSLMDTRYSGNLTTILSSELELGDILSLDESMGGRIHEKAQGHILNIRRDPERNYRLHSSSRQEMKEESLSTVSTGSSVENFQ